MGQWAAVARRQQEDDTHPTDEQGPPFAPPGPVRGIALRAAKGAKGANILSHPLGENAKSAKTVGILAK